jgi:hypothetical protein
MYTMYQSINASISQTAYLKLIDFWLIFCLLVPFVVFMVEIYWLLVKNRLREMDDKKAEAEFKKLTRWCQCYKTIFVRNLRIFVQS